MSRSSESKNKPTARPKPAALPAGPQSAPRLNAAMTCDTAFRVIARRYLNDLAANHEATCNGDPSALHRMRIALTHLRTAVLFFSPMVSDTQRTKIKRDLKWVNAQLGAVRDIDVATERLAEIRKEKPQELADYRFWNEKRADSHRDLNKVLRSVRYRRVMKDTSDWIDNGPWSTKGGERAKQRSSAIDAYSAEKLTRWQEKLVKKSRKLSKMSRKKRHRLRIMNKKLTYSIDFFEDLSSDERFSRLKAGLKHLRKTQRSLGQLNDDANARSLASALQPDGARAPLTHHAATYCRAGHRIFRAPGALRPAFSVRRRGHQRHAAGVRSGRDRDGGRGHFEQQ
jgi:CHAD domain-containing protein